MRLDFAPPQLHAIIRAMITGTNILADLGHVAQSASDGDDLFGRLGDDSHFRVVDDHVTPDAHR